MKRTLAALAALLILPTFLLAAPAGATEDSDCVPEAKSISDWATTPPPGFSSNTEGERTWRHYYRITQEATPPQEINHPAEYETVVVTPEQIIEHPAITEERLVSEAVYAVEYLYTNRPVQGEPERGREERWYAEGEQPGGFIKVAPEQSRQGELLEEAVYETVIVREAWVELVPAVTEERLVKEAWVEVIPGQEELREYRWILETDAGGEWVDTGQQRVEYQFVKHAVPCYVTVLQWDYQEPTCADPVAAVLLPDEGVNGYWYDVTGEVEPGGTVLVEAKPLSDLYVLNGHGVGGSEGHTFATLESLDCPPDDSVPGDSGGDDTADPEPTTPDPTNQPAEDPEPVDDPEPTVTVVVDPQPEQKPDAAPKARPAPTVATVAALPNTGAHENAGLILVGGGLIMMGGVFLSRHFRLRRVEQ